MEGHRKTQSCVHVNKFEDNYRRVDEEATFIVRGKASLTSSAPGCFHTMEGESDASEGEYQHALEVRIVVLATTASEDSFNHPI